MFERSRGIAAAVLGVFVGVLLAAPCAAAERHERPGAAEHGPTFTFSIGHGSGSTSGSIHLRDFSRQRETIKPLELPSAVPKPEPTFPSFTNPLQRHRMAMIAF
jgi:hypothetical protein